MDIDIMKNDANDGSIVLEVSLDLEDIDQLKEQAQQALAIERMLPEQARTPYAGASESAYFADFIEMRATNDALEVRNIVPAAIPVVESAGYVEGEPYRCTIKVYVRPEIGLTSLEPVDLATNRIAKPGFSAKAGRAGDENVEFVDDEKTLRMAMTRRLDSELPEPIIRALADEYQNAFEAKLAASNIDPEMYQTAHGLNEEQYDLMMARTALSNAHWKYALDAVFVGNGFTVTDSDLIASFELQFPGFGQQLFELHDLRNDLYHEVERYRRGKALMWLKDNAIQ